MKNNLGNVWVALALQQFFNYRRTTVMVTKGVEPRSLPDPRSLVDACLAHTDEPLNPMEFHGRRRPEWPQRPQAAKGMG